MMGLFGSTLTDSAISNVILKQSFKLLFEFPLNFFQEMQSLVYHVIGLLNILISLL